MCFTTETFVHKYVGKLFVSCLLFRVHEFTIHTHRAHHRHSDSIIALNIFILERTHTHASLHIQHGLQQKDRQTTSWCHNVNNRAAAPDGLSIHLFCDIVLCFTKLHYSFYHFSIQIKIRLFQLYIQNQIRLPYFWHYDQIVFYKISIRYIGLLDKYTQQ